MQYIKIQVVTYITNFKENKMKKLLATLLATISLSAVAQKETVTMFYSWSPADTAANFYRTLADESNKLQNKYNFIFDAKPGAGGTVAANHVLNNPNSIWINSSAAFIRPNLFPNESHDMSQFRSLMPMCVAPFVVTSTKYKSWQDVPRNAKLNIGISGLGATTHLVALQVATQYPNMQIVPFKSTSDALLGVLSGTTDFAVGFIGDSEQYTKSDAAKRVYQLGMTGKESIKGIPLLRNQGFPAVVADMSTPQQIFIPRKFPEEKFQEIRKIFVEAARSKSVRDANAADNCVPNNQIPTAELDNWFNSQLVLWRRLSATVKLDK
jgi:tripartite-type tricarboxylate transporter receptor subunit TctC